jgi:hypothetical protein
VNNLSGNPAFLAAIESLMNMVRYSCMLIVPTFVLIQLILSLARGFTWLDGVRVDYTPVARGFILMVSLFFYAEVLGLISGAIGGFAGFIVQPENIYTNLKDMGAAVTPQPDPAEDSLAGYLGQAVEWVGNFNLHYWLQSLVVGGIASTARKIIEILRQTLLGFLYVVGPLSLSLSVLPGFGGLLKKWFQHYLSVQCWSLTLIILDNLVDLYTRLSQTRTSAMTGLSLAEASEKIDILLITIVITLLYLMVPYLTSLYVGQSSSAMFTSKAVGLATAGASLAGGGAVLAGSAAAGGASGLSAVGRAVSGSVSQTTSWMREVREDDHDVGSERPSSNAASQAIPVRKT